MRAIRGVLLDIDGTLVDSNDVHARAWVEALAEAGFEVPFARVRPLIGKGGDKLMPEVTGLAGDDPRLAALGKRRTQLLLERHVREIRALPGARALLERLKALDYVVAIATSANEDELGAILRAGGVEDLFDARTSSDDAERSKPDPDIVAAAVERAGVPADACVMIGDTPYDVSAARKAGVDIIGVRSGGWGDPDLAGAIAVYDGPADLLARLDASPLART